jgi:uncharacterized protein (TIGR03067 family)
MQAIMLLVFLAPDAPDDAALKEIGRLDGAWKVVAAEYKGKKMDKSPVEQVIFASGKARDEAASINGAGVFRYQIDTAKSPKSIEATAVGEKGKQQKLIGIYEVGKDTLRLSLVPDGKKLPDGFKTGPDDEAVVLELKREKK